MAGEETTRHRKERVELAQPRARRHRPILNRRIGESLLIGDDAVVSVLAAKGSTQPA
jgi:hypothetical protein